MQINQKALSSLRRRTVGEIVLALVADFLLDVFYAYLILTLPDNINNFLQMVVYLLPAAIFFVFDTAVTVVVLVRGYFRLRMANRVNLFVAAVNGKAGAGPLEIAHTLQISPKKLKKQLIFLIREDVIDNAYWNKVSGNFTSVRVIPSFYNAEKCNRTIGFGRGLCAVGSFLASLAFTVLYFIYTLSYFLSDIMAVALIAGIGVGVIVMIVGNAKIKAAKTARIDALCLVGDPARSPATIARKLKVSQKKVARRMQKAIQNGYYHTIRRLPNKTVATA